MLPRSGLHALPLALCCLRGCGAVLLTGARPARLGGLSGRGLGRDALEGVETIQLASSGSGSVAFTATELEELARTTWKFTLSLPLGPPPGAWEEALPPLDIPDAAAELVLQSELELAPSPEEDDHPAPIQSRRNLIGATSEILKDVAARSAGLSRDCSERYGADMLENTRRNVKSVCRGPEAFNDSSQIYCLVRKPYDIGRYLCVFENVELEGYNADYWTKPDQAHHQVRLAARACRMEAAEHVDWGWWEKGPMENLAKASAFQTAEVVEHPLLIYALWTAPAMGNFYEWFHDYLSLIEAVLTLKWPLGKTEVQLTNIPRDGIKIPFFDIMKRTFGDNFRYADEWYPHGTVFKRLALPPSPGISTITAFGGRSGKVTCRAPVVEATVNFVHSLFVDDGEAALTMRSRDPARGTCSLLLMHRERPRNARSSSRWVKSDEIVAKLNEELKKAKLSHFQAVVHRPENMSIATALAEMRRAAVLFGVHGAGLMHAAFLPRGSTLLELFCGDRGSSNGHYKTIARMVGVRYDKMEALGCLDHTPAAVARRLLAGIRAGEVRCPPPSLAPARPADAAGSLP